jgi:hypothetical protein
MVVSVAIGRGALDVVIVLFANIKFAANDGFHSVFMGGVHEMHRAKNISVVSHGDGGHAKFFHALAQFLYVASPVKQGVVGMQVQMNELGHRLRKKLLIDDD